jgi:hypothetical protein
LLLHVAKRSKVLIHPGTVAFKVPDALSIVERAVQAGCKAPRGMPPKGYPGFVTDPDGYTVELIEGPSFAK